MAHGDAREGKWRGKMRMEWVASRLASTLHTPRLPVVDWTDPPRRLKWTRPFRRKTNSGFCACAVTFRVGSTLQGYDYNSLLIFHLISNLWTCCWVQYLEMSNCWLHGHAFGQAWEVCQASFTRLSYHSWSLLSADVMWSDRLWTKLSVTRVLWGPYRKC